ncbi:hypothetical protein XENOCAPTIV_007948 [Xenoophorus captivus]|uniref:Uncharacterized protein n=1 Tax=Xenoophorus captivus TaxID=1517983 RepID=A0ABV0S1M7_9TELE
MDLQLALQSSGVHEDSVFSGGLVDLEEGDALRLISTAVRLVTERASHGDWILRSSWLSNLGRSYKYLPGTIDMSQLPHPMLMHLRVFFDLWDAYVLQAVQSGQPHISDHVICSSGAIISGTCASCFQLTLRASLCCLCTGSGGVHMSRVELLQLRGKTQLWPLMEGLSVLNQLRLSTDLLHLALSPG